MTSASKMNHHLHVAVYWGGAELGTYSRPLRSSRGVTAGKSVLAEIRSVIWPKWDELEIVLRTATGLVLNPNLAWHGVISDGSNIYHLSTQAPRRQMFEIKSGTTASLRFEDISVAIKVGPKVPKESRSAAVARGFSGGLLSLFADRPNEWMTFGIGLGAASVIAISSYLTLHSRPNDHYTSIAELPADRLLPFIAPKYLSEAPNVMQAGLDRFNYVHSVWNFYDDFASTVALGTPPDRPTKVFPTTLTAYKGFAAAAAETIRDSERRQRGSRQKGLPSISIPVVRGESASGSVLRTLDKIAVISSTSDEQVRRRNKVAEEYEKDVGYVYTPKEGDSVNKAFAAISAGFLGLEDDEKAQQTQAKHFSNKAAMAQINLYGKDRLRFGGVGCCQMPLGAPISHDNISWGAAEIISGASSAVELASLKASTWGAPVREATPIQEPKSGKIPAALVEKTISAGRYQVRLCYELSLRRNQVTSGTMEWKWLIDTQGKISRLELVRSSIKDEELVRCVRQKIASWKFARPQGGSVEVRYPFEFSRDKG